MDKVQRFFRELYQKKNVNIHLEVFGSDNRPKRHHKVSYSGLSNLTKDSKLNYYFTPTELKGNRKKESAKTCYTLFFDFDSVKVPNNLLELAHVIVSRGDYHSHVYVFIEPFEIKNEQDIHIFERAEKTIARQVKADLSVTDITRLMRVPYTFRNKNNEPPVLYDIMHTDYSKDRHKLESIERFFVTKNEHTKKEKHVKINNSLARLLKNKPIGDGERTDFFYKASCRCHDFGFTEDDTLKKLMKINTDPSKVSEPLDSEKIKKIIRDAYNYARMTLGIENEKLQEKNENILQFLKEYSYIELEDTYIDPKGQSIPKNAMNNKLAPFTNLQANSLGYIHKYNLIRSYERTIYAPYENRVYKDSLNLWNDPQVQVKKGKTAFFTDFLKYLIPEAKERDHFLDFVAYSIQYPLNKINHALLLVGGRGVGKSTIGVLLETICGTKNITKPSNDALREQYTGWLHNKKFCFVNEMKQASRVAKNELKARLDTILADAELPVRKMRQEMILVNNIVSFIGCTNDDNAVYITNDERRWAVLGCANQPHEDKEVFYDQLYKDIENNKESLLYFFKNRDVSHFNPKKPPKVQNAIFYAMLENSQTIVESWIVEAIEEGHPVFFTKVEENDNKVETIHRIENIIENIDVPPKIASLREWNRKYVISTLKRLGAKEIRKREYDHYYRYWDIRPIANKYKEVKRMKKTKKVLIN